MIFAASSTFRSAKFLELVSTHEASLLVSAEHAMQKFTFSLSYLVDVLKCRAHDLVMVPTASRSVKK